MSNSYTIEIPYVLPNANAQLRMHFRGRERIKTRCMEYLLVAKSQMLHAGLPFPKRLTQFHLTIERHATRAQDRDNAIAGHKGLIDAMKERDGMGLILDDAPHQMLSCSVIHIAAKRKNERTIIKLTEA